MFGFRVAALTFCLANMLADLGMLRQRHFSASLVASAFLTQNILLPCGEGAGRKGMAAGVAGSSLVSNNAKFHHLSRRAAALVGPWCGLLIAQNFNSCIWCSLTASSLLLPFIFMDGHFTGNAQPVSTESNTPFPDFNEPIAKSAIAFILFLRFFLSFGFYAFNALLASSLSLSHAGPWLLASIGSVCGVGELVAVQISCLLGMRGQCEPGKLHWSSAASVASVALKVVALSRLSAFLVSSTGSFISSAILLLSLFVSILAATLLSDLQSRVVSHFVHAEGQPGILNLEGAADALAGIAGPLYTRSMLTYHGPGAAMAGIFNLYVLMHFFVHLGLSRIITPFLSKHPLSRDGLDGHGLKNVKLH